MTDEKAAGRREGGGRGRGGRGILGKLRGGFDEEVRASREADRRRDRERIGRDQPPPPPSERRSRPQSQQTRQRDARNRAKQPTCNHNGARGHGRGRGKPQRHNQGQGAGHDAGRRRQQSQPTGDLTTLTTKTPARSPPQKNRPGQPAAAGRSPPPRLLRQTICPTERHPTATPRLPVRNHHPRAGRSKSASEKQQQPPATGQGPTVTMRCPAKNHREGRSKSVGEKQRQKGSGEVGRPSGPKCEGDSAVTRRKTEQCGAPPSPPRQPNGPRGGGGGIGDSGSVPRQKTEPSGAVVPRRRTEPSGAPPSPPHPQRPPRAGDAAVEPVAVGGIKASAGGRRTVLARQSSAASVDAALAFARRASVSGAERSLLAHQSSTTDAFAAAMTATVTAEQGVGGMEVERAEARGAVGAASGLLKLRGRWPGREKAAGIKAVMPAAARTARDESNRKFHESMQALLLCSSDSESESLHASGITLGDMLCAARPSAEAVGSSHLHDSYSTALSVESHASLIMSELGPSSSIDSPGGGDASPAQSHGGSKSSWENFSHDSNFGRLQQQQQQPERKEGSPHQGISKRRSWGPLSGFDSKSMLWVNFEDEELLDDLSDGDEHDAAAAGARGVTFAPAHTNCVVTHIGRWEMDDDEIRRAWYDADDFDEMRMGLIRTVAHMRGIPAIEEEKEEGDSGEGVGGEDSRDDDECDDDESETNDGCISDITDDDDGSQRGDRDDDDDSSSPCLRGLEHMATTEANEAHAFSIRNATNAVLRAQDELLLEAARLFEERESSCAPPPPSTEERRPSSGVSPPSGGAEKGTRTPTKTSMSTEEVRAIEEEVWRSMAQISVGMTQDARAAAAEIGRRDAEEVKNTKSGRIKRGGTRAE